MSRLFDARLAATFLAACAISAVLVSGCAKAPLKCPSPEESPALHYAAGMELLDAGKADEAAARFERAAYCDEKFAPAEAGLALVWAERARTGRAGTEHARIDADKAHGAIKRSSSLSETSEDEYAWRVASMRVSTALKPNGWLDDVEAQHGKAARLKTDPNKLLYYVDREAADYFMGLAYSDSGAYQKARDSYSRVLAARREGKWHARADAAWRRTDRVVRALAGLTLGKAGERIAVAESVSRGELAALLIDEVGIERVYAEKARAAAPDVSKEEFVPADVAGHRYKSEITTLIRLGVRGLEPRPDRATRALLFMPSEPVTRKELAMTLEDVLIRAAGDDKMAAAFLGHASSPFPDVPPSAAWYNAVMNVTTKGMMEADTSGRFRPDDRVDGADAVLAVRVLREKLAGR